ncbi:MAG: hypothetical protein N3C60_04820 [Calditerrivibrio sp.]|nr:hypothetical protein [Calditerrivibrio sp.]
MYRYLFVAFLLVFLSTGCGKKLDPRPKDSIIIPAPNLIVLENTDEGILIKNAEEYNVFVEKSSIDDLKCADDFRFLIKIPSGGEFLDKNVTEAHSYVYRFTNVDEEIGVESIFRAKSILYSKPISVKNLVINPKPTGEAILNIFFDREPRGYLLKVNNKELGRFNRDNITILLEDKEENEIVITPYDQYNNLGKTKRVLYKNPRIYFITPPDVVRSITNDDFFLVNWDDVPYAKGYRVYNDKELILAETMVPYLKIKAVDTCQEIYIASFNDEVESEKRVFKVCR